MRKGNSIRFEVPRFPSTFARDLQDSAGKCEREDGREKKKYEPEAEINSKSYMRV